MLRTCATSSCCVLCPCPRKLPQSIHINVLHIVYVFLTYLKAAKCHQIWLKHILFLPLFWKTKLALLGNFNISPKPKSWAFSLCIAPFQCEIFVKFSPSASYKHVKMTVFVWQFKVDLVVHGNTPIMACEDDSDPYAIPKERGIFETITTPNMLTTADIVERIIKNK